MVEPVVVTAVFDDDHGLVVLNPDVDLVGHDVDLVDLDVGLVDLDVGLVDLDVGLYLSDVCDVLLYLLLSPDVVELVEQQVHLNVLDGLIQDTYVSVLLSHLC